MDILHDHTLFSKTTDVDLGTPLFLKCNNSNQKVFGKKCVKNTCEISLNLLGKSLKNDCEEV